MTILREIYWLLKARKLIKNIISSCIKCKKHTPKHLTKFRIECTDQVFEIVGIDSAGPFYLENTEKVWIVVVTCAIYRATRLELIKSLSTEALIFILKRSLSRRGRMRVIYSDNGTNLRSTSIILVKLDWED